MIMVPEKLKIVWICHFSNKEIQDRLPLWKGVNEFASWIANMLIGFEKREDVELHVVAPHIYIKCDKSFVLRGIHYHFLSYGFPIINRPWPSFFALDAILGYPIISGKIKRKVTKINPDIVNLQGAENAYYSSSILKLKEKFPCAITIQGFACHMESQKSQINKRRIITEKEILHSFNYFYLDNEAIQVVQKYSPNMVGRVIWWPAAEKIIDTIPEVPYDEKKYDVLFCGRIEKSKGIEEFIKVVSIIKTHIPDMRACVIGSGLPQYYSYLKELATDLNCKDNIDFKGFIQTQKEMFAFFKTSKMLLVPTLIDRYPSTIREALRIGTPVIAYSTGSIPWTNSKGRNIILIEHGNINEMAIESCKLLNNRCHQKELIAAGRNFYEEEFSCDKNVNRFIEGYREILFGYKNK